MTKTFPEAIAGIRGAEWASEVREDIAQGMEYVSGFAEDAQSSANAAAEARQRAESAAQSILGYAGGAIVANGTVTLSADGWTSAAGTYPWQYLTALEASKASYLPVAVPTADSLAAVRAARTAPLCQALDGQVQFWAARKPTADIVAQVALIAPGQSTPSTTAVLDQAVLGQMVLGGEA